MKNIDLEQVDHDIYDLIHKEEDRQKHTITLIPSENYASSAVREAVSSMLTNKYSEGYSGKRYYNGNKFIDEVEMLAQERVKQLFGVKYVNVQPYSGSPANQAVYFALLQPGDTVLGFKLSDGGHLTHGANLNFSSRYYNSVQYGVGKDGYLNYEAIAKIAKETQPKLIVAGSTAYPRTIDFEKFAEIAKSVGAYLLADISHISGLVATGQHPTPVGHADIIMSTTHKTLRGPRGAIIMTNKEDIYKSVNKAIMPGLQGGPHNNVTAGIAVVMKENLDAGYTDYAKQVIKNASTLAIELIKYEFDLVSGGTDNHLILIDLRNKKISGKEYADRLEEAGIVANRNSVPFDTAGPFDPSGLRIGTPAITTRGAVEKDMVVLAKWMNEVLEKSRDLNEIAEEVKEWCEEHPIF